MRFATPETVLSVLGVQQVPGTLAAAGVALDASAPLLAKELDTELAYSSQRDYFTIRSADRRNPVLRLSRGFVSADDAVVVTSSGIMLDAADYFVDLRAGVIRVLATLEEGAMNTSVDFTSGFETDPAATAYAAAGFPDELATAHASLAASYYQLNPAVVSKDKARTLGKLSVAGYQAHARQSLSRFQRPRAGCLWSDHTVFV